MDVDNTILFAIGALVNFGFAVGFGWRTRRRLATWASARGRITAMVPQSDNSGETPVVTFSDSDGHQHEFKNYIGGSNWYRLNTRVDVLYDPDDPERAQINDWTSCWGITTIGVTTGALFSVMTFFLA